MARDYLDSRIAANVRHMLQLDHLVEIPQSLCQAILDVEKHLKPFGKHVGIEHLAVIIVDWQKRNANAIFADWNDMEPGTPLGIAGSDDVVTFVRKPSGKDSDLVYVRTSDMEEGKYKKVPVADIRQPELV